MPLLFYTYAFHPWMVTQNEGLYRLFPDRSVLDTVGLLNLMGVGAFCLGLSWTTVGGRPRGAIPVPASPVQRQRLYHYAVMLGAAAVGAFVFMVVYSGGFERVFFQGRKPFLYAPSGYISELQMLSFPAILLLAFGVRARRVRLEDWLLAVLIVSPHLIMASLGGRRGPAFLSCCALAGFWFLATGRRPRLSTVLVGLAGVGLLMIFLIANRKAIYAGAEGDFDLQAFTQRLMGEIDENVIAGDEFVVGSAYVLGAQHYGSYTWGKRLFCLVFVRPIPRQIWPSKYEDLELGWMADAPGSGGLTAAQWREALGFVPHAGSAGGFISDLFMEFSWACVAACFLLGWFYNQIWLRSQQRGGLWTILYLELLVLSVYLPAQSLGAWLYRLLLLAVPTWLVWRVLLGLPVSRIREVRAGRALAPRPRPQ